MIAVRRHFLKGVITEPGPSEGHQQPFSANLYLFTENSFVGNFLDGGSAISFARK